MADAQGQDGVLLHRFTGPYRLIELSADGAAHVVDAAAEVGDIGAPNAGTVAAGSPDRTWLSESIMACLPGYAVSDRPQRSLGQPGLFEDHILISFSRSSTQRYGLISGPSSTGRA